MKILRNVDWYVKIAFIVSVVLGIVGFILPPTGVIDPSVLTFCAELIGGGSLITFLTKLPEYLEKGYSAKFKKGDVEIEVEGKENQ